MARIKGTGPRVRFWPGSSTCFSGYGLAAPMLGGAQFDATTSRLPLMILALLLLFCRFLGKLIDALPERTVHVDSFQQFAADVWPGTDMIAVCKHFDSAIDELKAHVATEHMIHFLTDPGKRTLVHFLNELSLSYGVPNLIRAASSIPWDPTHLVNMKFYVLRHGIGSWMVGVNQQPLLLAYCSCNANTTRSSSYSDLFGFVPYAHGYIWQSVLDYAWTSPTKAWEFIFEFTKNIVRNSSSNLFPPTLDSLFYHPVGHAALYAAYLSRSGSSRVTTGMSWSNLTKKDLREGEIFCEAATGYALVPCYDGLYDAFCSALPRDLVSLQVSRSGTCDGSHAPYLCYRACFSAMRVLALRNKLHNCKIAVARRGCIHALAHKFFLHYHISAFGTEHTSDSVSMPYYGLYVEKFIPPFAETRMATVIGKNASVLSWCHSLDALPKTSFWTTCASASLAALASGYGNADSGGEVCKQAVNALVESQELCSAYFIPSGDWAQQHLI